MNGIFITQNDDYDFSPHDWLVTEYRGEVVTYTRRAFETVREAQSWALEMAVTLVKELNLTNKPPEVIFMDGDAFDAARREFQNAYDKQHHADELMNCKGVFLSRSDSLGDFVVLHINHGAQVSRERFDDLAPAEVRAEVIASTLVVEGDGSSLDRVIFYDRNLLDHVVENVTKNLTDTGAEVKYIHRDFERQMRDRLINDPMGTRMGDLLRLYSSVGAMMSQIDREYDHRMRHAETVEQRVDLVDQRARRVGEVERHLIEVFTFIAPELISSWKRLTMPADEVQP